MKGEKMRVTRCSYKDCERIIRIPQNKSGLCGYHYKVLFAQEYRDRKKKVVITKKRQINNRKVYKPIIISNIMENLICKQCGWFWVARVDNPKMCPKCKDHNWNKPKKKEARLK